MLAYSLLGADAIHDQSNGWFYVHAPGIDEPLLAIKRAPTTYMMQARLQIVSDGMGQMVSIADSAGGFTNMYAGPDHYTPGNWATAGMTSHAQTFDPQRLSADSGAISSFRTRQYDPSTGSWLQEDHAGLAGGVNLYQYNGNDPNSFRDPAGFDADANRQSGDSGGPADSVAKVVPDSTAADPCTVYRNSATLRYICTRVHGPGATGSNRCAAQCLSKDYTATGLNDESMTAEQIPKYLLAGHFVCYRKCDYSISDFLGDFLKGTGSDERRPRVHGIAADVTAVRVH